MNKKYARRCLDAIYCMCADIEKLQSFAKMIEMDCTFDDIACGYEMICAHLDGIDLTSYTGEDALQLRLRRWAGKDASALHGDAKQMRQQLSELEDKVLVKREQAIEYLDDICSNKEALQSFAKMVGLDANCGYEEIRAHLEGENA